MKILFDQGTPVPLRRFLHPHVVDTADERQWSTLQNGDLLNAAEEDGYEVLITTDQNLRYQQNLTERKIHILVLCTTSWPRIRNQIDIVVEALLNMPENGYLEIRF
jgi:predicted nuclease of predicted toxin-antitoxin system